MKSRSVKEICRRCGGNGEYEESDGGVPVFAAPCDRCGGSGWIAGDPVAGIADEPCGCDEDWGDTSTVSEVKP